MVWIDPCILLNPAPSSFQVPWFGTIPIAVSNDISEQSLEEFRREVRNLLGCHLGGSGRAGMSPGLSLVLAGLGC